MGVMHVLRVCSMVKMRALALVMLLRLLRFGCRRCMVVVVEW